MYRILLVDDDPKNLKATAELLKLKGYDVETTTSAFSAIERVKAEEFALVLLDYQMPEMQGDELAALIHQVNPLQQVAMYSCDTTREAVKSSLKAGALDFIEKTVSNAELLKAIEGFCNRYEAGFRTIRPPKNKSENCHLIESIKMVGQSQAMADVALTVKKVAAARDTSVLITGESGVGKELIARALHTLSPRASYPFVAINCAAIPKDLLESELFGHIRGAFTGATDNKEGKFKIANGGTIFLDEIGDMPLELQAKLLRVLQERFVDPVGAKTPIKVDVRIICATHRNLDQMVKQKTFREDLVYRIRVVEIEIPALRERPEDIEPLVEHFTARFNRDAERKKYFQRKTLEQLRNYPWPGNVRELEACVEKHLLLAPEAMIRPENLDRKLFETKFGAITAGKTLAAYRLDANIALLQFLEATIEKADGNKAEAARRLGIKPNHLNELLKDTREKIADAAKTASHERVLDGAPLN
jgi:DNA-binding NtrC family response regulator